MNEKKNDSFMQKYVSAYCLSPLNKIHPIGSLKALKITKREQGMTQGHETLPQINPEDEVRGKRTQISKRLKKYQPINSSCSIHYEMKLSGEKYHNNQVKSLRYLQELSQNKRKQTKPVETPILKEGEYEQKVRFSTKKKPFRKYMEKVHNIRQQSQMMNKKSESIFRRVQKTKQYTNSQYDKLQYITLIYQRQRDKLQLE